jgi:hypothetical protein
MVAQESLELFVMVRIHAGQPVLLSKMRVLSSPANILQTIQHHLAAAAKP